MSQVQDGTPTEERLASNLREQVMEILRADGLGVDVLSDRLGVLPTTVEGVLHRSSWSASTAFWLIDGLDLPIEVEVRTRNGSAAKVAAADPTTNGVG